MFEVGSITSLSDLPVYFASFLFLGLKRMNFIPCIAFLCACIQISHGMRYEPNWDSLDKRPLPAWYDEGKVGVFIHWGVFSVPAFGNEWFWYRWKTWKQPDVLEYMWQNYRPDFTYADFAPMFRAEFYDPVKWAKIFEAAGAKYVVLVSKHHEGFTNWPSKYSWNWNAGDVGPNRDLVGDLATAIRAKTDIKFGVYHSMFEWYNPLYERDQANGFRTQDFVRQKTLPELYELVNNYKPEVIWSDGEWHASDVYWNSTEFLAWLYNDSPVKDTIVVNDRWGNTTRCKHGDFWDCTDHYTPGVLVPHKWESCMTIDKYSWGYRANAQLEDFHTIEDLIRRLVITVSLGGNVLYNIGPTSSGMIVPVYEERLRQIGSWLKLNGEAIYKTHVWSHQNDSMTSDAWYTASNNSTEKVVYAILLSWPKNGYVALGFPIPSKSTNITLVGHEGRLSFTPISGQGVIVTLPSLSVNELPRQWACVLKMTGLINHETKLDLKAFAQKLAAIGKEMDL